MQHKDKVLDELLIMQMSNGNNKAVSLFVKRWHNKLIWYSFQVLRDKEEAQDIVQENWHHIISGLQHLNEIGTYKAWMYRVIRNRSIDQLRKLKREQKAIDAMEVETEEQPNENAKTDKIDIVRKVLKNQPAEIQEILSLFYLQRQSVHEISTILEIPVGTVKSRLYRAREQMRKSLENVKHLLEL